MKRQSANTDARTKANVASVYLPSRPARLPRLEPGVFSGQATEVALEAGGRAEQKQARLLAQKLGVGCAA